MAEKEALRQAWKQKQRMVDPFYYKEQDVLIGERLKRVLLPFDTVGIYISQPEECDTRVVIDWLWDKRKRVFVPRIKGVDLEFVEICSWEQVQAGAYGILEPVAESKTGVKIEVQVVPLVAFDRAGHRLGHGKGYYDRYLRDYPGLIIGLGYDEQEVAEVPFDLWDVKLKQLITARGQRVF
ncbi:MAG: 5-formyltetrahydrofolate cyclo-ligase [Erysipelotrichaceae bacterium]|nr:5-formyltetrahydrofolate cyclo-ligase [Erysipelotrichaceae bacterium]